MIRRSTVFLAISGVLAGLSVWGSACAQIPTSSFLGSSSAASGEQEDDRLVVSAKELVYNKDKQQISAYDGVELSYQGQSVLADRVTYDQKNNRVTASGRVQIIDREGTMTTADRIELSGGFKDGFIHSLRAERRIPEENLRTRFSSPRAERIGGETTILEYGTYTACDSCQKKPEKPPLWQIKAARIIHDGKEKTIYYEDARFEVWGVPIMYSPYFWTPDPSVNRKTGFLFPGYSRSGTLGTSVQIPFFWAIAPNYDLTIRPSYYSRQGLLLQLDWRHRLETGAYSIRATGINQSEPDAFAKGRHGAGDKKRRGSLETEGEFLINKNWKWGWNVSLLSDKWFLENYDISGKGYSTLFYQEAVSTLYLKGAGDRSFFDLRGYHFKGLSTYDWQAQQPVIHPVLDYHKRMKGPEAIGGEVDYTLNLTSLSRSAAQYKQLPAQQERYLWLYETCSTFNKSACLLNGMAGTTTRLTLDTSWKRDFIDPVGQVWTPFVFARGDAYWMSQDNTGYQNAYQTLVANESDGFDNRFMVGAGLEYRYPLVASFMNSGTQIFEPIAQVIIRPNERRIGSLPNEDAQNFVFDDTNLFEWDKFSGYDRMEGGSRANLGAQYSLQMRSGAKINMLAGQSFRLGGRNSFAEQDFVNTGLDSGLDRDSSDLIGRLQIIPNKHLSLFARGRFDKSSFSPQRIEAGLSFNFETVPVNGSIFYTRYDEQPSRGYNYRREGLATAAQWKFSKNWSVRGSALFDLNYQDQTIITNNGQSQIQTWSDKNGFSTRSVSLGLGYDDECLSMNLSYTSLPKEYAEANGKKERDEIFALTLVFKSLGQINLSQNSGD